MLEQLSPKYFSILDIKNFMQIQIFSNCNYKILSENEIKMFLIRYSKNIFCKTIFKKLKLNIIFVDNKKIRLLNKNYLKKNSSTDIICFQYDKYSSDFFVSIEEVKKQSKIYRTTFNYELKFVLLHGLLHLKGMQDDTKDKKDTMLDYASNLMNKLK